MYEPWARSAPPVQQSLPGLGSLAPLCLPVGEERQLNHAIVAAHKEMREKNLLRLIILFRTKLALHAGSADDELKCMSCIGAILGW